MVMIENSIRIRLIYFCLSLLLLPLLLFIYCVLLLVLVKTNNENFKSSQKPTMKILHPAGLVARDIISIKFH